MLPTLTLLAQLSWSPLRPVQPEAQAPHEGEVEGGEGNVAPVEVPVEPKDEAGTWRHLLRADATAGWTSNARQITSEDGKSVFVNPAIQAGLQLTGSAAQQRAGGGSVQVAASALVLQNFALDGAVPANEGSGALRVQYTHPFTARSQGIFAVGGTIGTLAARRATDPRMAAIDPTSVNRTYASTALETAWLHALTATTRIGTGLSTTALFTVDDQDQSLAGDQSLRHRGLDQLLVNAEFGVEHDLTVRLRAEGLVRLLHAEQPFVLDLSTGTPRNVGPFRTDAATVLAGAAYDITEHFQADARAGASVSRALPDDPDQTPNLDPAALVRASYDDQRRRVSMAASYQYAAAVPRLGAGPTAGLLLSAYGLPYDQGGWRQLNLLAMAAVDQSDSRTTASSSLRVRNASATAALRWSIDRRFGVIGGVDVRASRFAGTGLVPADFDRTLVFVGISYVETNARDERTLIPFGDLPL